MDPKRRRIEGEEGEAMEEEMKDEFLDFEEDSDEEITLGTFDFTGKLNQENDKLLKKLSHQSVSISGEKDDEEMSDDDDDSVDNKAPATIKPYIPKKKEEYKMEELDFSNNAYKCFYRFMAPWPIPSFSYVYSDYDSSTFPYKLILVQGAQITDEHGNVPMVKGTQTRQKFQAQVWSVFNLYTTQYDSDDDEENPVPLKEKEIPPGFEVEDILQKGPFSDQNRVRVMPTGTNSSLINDQVIVAMYCDSGHVMILDIAKAVSRVSNRAVFHKPKDANNRVLYTSPFVSEGWALDWSKVKIGRLASGGQDNLIRVYDFDPQTGKTIEVCSLAGHKGSVEDIQWSPSEPHVLASCSCDGTIRVWDINSRTQQLVWKASKTDINVISWNPIDQTQIASGDDDGVIRVWNLQEIYQTALQRKSQFLEDAKPSQHFDFHKYAITSLEWHPTDSSTLVATSEDDTCTIWDFALEAEEEVDEEIPPQLLFVHMGLSNIKEAHWHNKIENTVVVCGENGFHIFRPADL